MTDEGCVVIIREAESHEDIKDHYSKDCFGNAIPGGCGLSCFLSGGPSSLCIEYTENAGNGAIAIEYEE